MGVSAPPDIQRAYSLFTVKAVDGDKRLITGLATTPEPDRVGDIIEPLGVSFKNPLPLLLFHDRTRPVGTVKFDKPTKDGVAFTATFPDVPEDGVLKDRIAEAWQSVKYGLIRGVSIGFRVLNDAVDFMKDSGGFRFREVEVLELSLVPIPANAGATIQTIKQYDTGAPATGPARVKHSPSDPGTPIVKVLPSRAEQTMKSIAEQIASYKSTRDQKFQEQQALMTKSADEGRTLEANESEQYDTLGGEIKSLDQHLTRLEEMQEAQKAAAVPAAGADPQAAHASRGGAPGAKAPVIQLQDQLPPGIGFARAVKAAVVARLDGRSMLEVAKEMYPSDNRLHGHLTHVMNLPNIIMHLKATVAAGTTTNSVWASALVDPTNLPGEFIEFLRPATIIGKFGTGNIPALRRVPFNVRMVEQTTGGSGYWVGQGAPKPLTAFEFAPVTLAITKVAAISVVTEELARLSTPSAEQLTRDGLRDALVERIDRDLVDPAEAGTANIQPPSLSNGVTPLTSAGTSADNARTDLAKLVNEFLQANQNVEGLVLIMPTSLALALSFQVNSLGQPEFPGLTMAGGNLNGIPVITSQYAANASGHGNLVIAVNAREVFLADDGQVVVDASREASLQMLDNPTNNSATGTPTTMVSMWQTNSIALRAERFINWQKRRATAVSYMDDVNWGSIGSPS